MKIQQLLVSNVRDCQFTAIVPRTDSTFPPPHLWWKKDTNWREREREREREEPTHNNSALVLYLSPVSLSLIVEGYLREDHNQLSIHWGEISMHVFRYVRERKDKEWTDIKIKREM